MISWIGAKTSWQLMLRVLRELMEITDAQAEGDAAKITAMRTCVGWFSSPVCALIYQVAKYTAMCSTKGYAIGRKLSLSGWRGTACWTRMWVSTL